MENKRTDVLFGIVVIAFLVLTIILIKDFNAKRVNDFKIYSATLSNIVRSKNDKIKTLSDELAVEKKENEDLKNTLSETRNSLDALSKKLVQPTAPAAPANVPAATAK